MDNPYLRLTAEFNRGRLRTLLSSGQAVVMHRLAIMSKDGDWILREDEEAVAHLIGVLGAKGARYRFGAPLDLRWMTGGWSSHFQFIENGLRIRTDFVSRPPRISEAELGSLWAAAESSGDEVIGLEPLAAIKLTNREKDYAVVGELARRMTDRRAQLLYSRSSRDLMELAARDPDLVAEMSSERPLLAKIGAGRDALDEALDRERRTLMRRNETRLARYLRAAEAWAEAWRAVEREIAGMPLEKAHSIVVARAEGILPHTPHEDEP